MTWTWETLTRADRATFQDLMRTGHTPDPAQIAGHTYAGLNRGLVPKLTGERFEKVFHAGEPAGHNIVPRRGGPVELGWFSIRRDGRTLRFDYDVPHNQGVTARCAESRTTSCCRTRATTTCCSVGRGCTGCRWPTSC